MYFAAYTRGRGAVLMAFYSPTRWRMMFGLCDGIPEWHHRHSRKMRLEKAHASSVTITASAAQLIVTERAGAPEGDQWVVTWQIIFRTGGVRGRIIMNAMELCGAFGLNDLPSEGECWLADEDHDAVAIPGKYFRYGDYLNIPGPGTGNDDDPNISVLLSPDIKKAITEMVMAVGRMR